jgi:Rap1a immunity proteins
VGEDRQVIASVSSPEGVFMRRITALAATAMLTAFSSSALPETPLTGTQLHEHCLTYKEAPRSGAGLFCAAYVRGFVNGASAIDGRIRTGGGKVELPPRPHGPRASPAPPGDPVYCIDESITIDRLITEMLSYASEYPPGERTTASDLLDATLRQFHACPRVASRVPGGARQYEHGSDAQS